MRGEAGPTALCALLCAGVAAGQSVDETAEQSLERVIVTGTRLQRAAEQSAQEVRVYDRKRIQRSGQTTMADFLATVPEVSINSNESSFGATTARLRGAREGSTLILINGRRTQAVTAEAALIGWWMGLGAHGGVLSRSWRPVHLWATERCASRILRYAPSASRPKARS